MTHIVTDELWDWVLVISFSEQGNGNSSLS
jgi:hypothetical protein